MNDDRSKQLATEYLRHRKKADEAFATDGAACVSHAAAAHYALSDYAKHNGITTDEAAARIHREAR